MCPFVGVFDSEWVCVSLNPVVDNLYRVYTNGSILNIMHTRVCSPGPLSTINPSSETCLVNSVHMLFLPVHMKTFAPTLTCLDVLHT